MSDLVPTEVNQVWVVTRIAGSPTINLRTADGKFMSCDQYGVVSSGREASPFSRCLVIETIMLPAHVRSTP